MNTNKTTASWDALSAADLQDLVALDRLAGQLAPQASLRRYARQHSAPAPRRGHGWQRLIAGARRFFAEQTHLQEVYSNRNDVSGGDALAAARTLRWTGSTLQGDIAPLDRAER